MLACVLLMSGAALPSHAAEPAGLAFTLPSFVSDADMQGALTSSAGVILNPTLLSSFYARHGFETVWSNFSGIEARARDVEALLSDSWTHGLNPAKYHAEDIKLLLAAPHNAKARARLDVLLTDGFVRYVRDLSGIRIDPQTLGLRPVDWRQPYTAQQALEFLETEKNPAAFLKSLPPRSRTYDALRDELRRLGTEVPPAWEAVIPLDFGGKILRPGRRHTRVPDLRLRMGVEPLTKDVHLYDDRLAAAVLAFQRAHALKDDGLIGGQTLELLNRSQRGRVLQIVANLERLRWANTDRPRRFVIVNIPAATLWAVEDNAVVLEMPVIVGREKRETPSFITDITGVRFNPNWTVPPTIKKEDMLPKLRADPNYFADKGMELIERDAQGLWTVNPASVDWNAMTEKDLHRFQMVQMPGANNPLGRVRILMPNGYNVYLHDTNEKGRFGRSLRAQSSGCVRMSQPEKMADFVLKEESGWTQEKIEKTIRDGKMRDIMISKPFPVYLVYYSAWIDRDGKVIYGNDIYGADRALVGALKTLDGFALPGHNNDVMASSGRP